MTPSNGFLRVSYEDQYGFALLDRSRRWIGRALDTLGLGPSETPYRVVCKEQGVALRRYDNENADGPVLLIVPAPIKRPYIWDLTPEVSVVRHCLRHGVRVYLIQWEQPGQSERDFGLAEYGDRLISHCVETVCKETEEAQLFLAGHSLGGTLAAIFSALHPDRIRGLVLLGAPLHFGRNVGAIDAFVATAPKAQAVTERLGNVPGSFISMVAFLAAPATFGWSRWMDLMASMRERDAMKTHLRVAGWTFEEMPLPQRLFEEVVDLLYREDRFTRGTLLVGHRIAASETINAPLLSVIDPRCRLVPPQAVLPFLRSTRSQNVKVLWYVGDTGVALQHVGMLVGREAHTQLWPKIIRWMQSYDR